jgi:hypothetical protein
VGEHFDLKAMTMKKAFKTYDMAPEHLRPAGVPLDWPWQVIDIKEPQESSFVENGFTVMTASEFHTYKSQREQAFHDWANQYDQDQTAQELRVLDHVADQYKNLPSPKIDFRAHLRENIYYQKNLIMLPNGRPQKALYSYEGVLIAEIEFIFEVDAFNFMTRRIEKLAYYKRNGTITEQWIIADDSFDRENPYHLREIMKERSEARSLILEEIKAFLNGVLASFYVPQGKTYQEILEIAGQFWAAYATPINSWINVGSPQFAVNLNAETNFPFLDVNIAENVTVKQFVLSKIVY